MTIEFEKSIKDPKQSVAIDFSYPGRPLLIAFGGIVGALTIPPFEFFNLTRNLNVNKIYLRDLSQTWYHAGIPGISEDIEGTAAFIKGKIDESGVSKTIIFGNSMGGYAALLFGVLIKADIIHAFSAQTFIHKIDCIRNKKKLTEVHKKFADKYFDLQNVIDPDNNLSELHLYYDCNDQLDEKHAMHLMHSQHVILHSFSGGGHSLIKLLKDSGELQKIITSSLEQTDEGDRSKQSKPQAGHIIEEEIGKTPENGLKNIFKRLFKI